MSKGNGKFAAITSREDMERRVETARDCHRRQKDAAAEAVAEAYLLYRETRDGMGKKWFDEQIAKFNLDAETANSHLKSEQDRAKKFVEGALTANDHLNSPAANPEQALVHDVERAKLRRIHAMTSAEKISAKLFSAKPRDDSSLFMPVVRYVFNFNRHHHGAMVSRYCLVMEWIASNLGSKPDLDVDTIKQAIKEAKGFDRVIELQRDVSKTDTDAEKDAEIIAKAIADQAKSIAREVGHKGLLDIQASSHKDGFVLLLARMSGDGMAVLGQAESSDNDIDTAVRNFGKVSLVGDDDASMEFIGRVLDIAAIIKDRQEIISVADGKTKVSTARSFSLKADVDGQPHLVVSLNHADSSPVFYARAKADNMLTFNKGSCVLSGAVRRRMEKEMDDPARRRFLSLKINTEPKTAEGKPAESPLSWELHNRALAQANRSSAKQSFYWTALSNITAKPLDIDNFNPQFQCALDQDELRQIFQQHLEPWKTSVDSKKSSRVFALRLEDHQLEVICGDADPVVLSARVDCPEKLVMNFRMQDMHAIFEALCKKPGSDYQLIGDPAGLLRISWQDKFGVYQFHQPTIAADGKLQNRRVAPMLPEPTPLAAE
jgi:hypothetical protein